MFCIRTTDSTNTLYSIYTLEQQQQLNGLLRYQISVFVCTLNKSEVLLRTTVLEIEFHRFRLFLLFEFTFFVVVVIVYVGEDVLGTKYKVSDNGITTALNLH